MKMTKKVLSIVLAVAMVLSMAIVSFARERDEVLDGSETLTWTLSAQVMEGTGVSESVALNAENTVLTSVKATQIKKQRADVTAYKSSREDLPSYAAGNTTPIEVNPGDMVWVTTHVEASDSLYIGTLSQDWYYDSNVFMTSAMSITQATWVNEDSQIMAFADGTVSGAPWGRLLDSYRTNWVQNAKGLTAEQKASHHVNHIVVQYDVTMMSDEYGGELYEALDEDIYAFPVYVRADATPGAVGTILMTNNGFLVCDDGEGDWIDTMYAIPEEGHIVENQVLTFKVAGGSSVDYTALENAINDYKALDGDAYTSDSWAAVVTAYNNAVKAKESTDQTVVTAAANALADAIKNLEEKVVLNYTRINNAIGSVPADLSAYTKSTATAATSAKAAAEAAVATATTQADLDNAAAALEGAVAALEAKANFTGLDAALEEAADVNADDWTEESYDALQDAVAAAQSFDRDETGLSQQAAVNAAAEAIYDAIDALDPKPIVLDYTAWKQATAQEPADTDAYTPNSVAAYEAAKAAAYAAKATAEVAGDQAALNAAAADLVNAVALLAEKADKTALKAAIDDKPEYTADYYSNWSIYEQALANAESVYADDNASAAVVAAAASALNTAKAQLVIAAANYDAVTEAENAAAALNAEDYTDASWAKLEKALAAVVEGLDKTEQTTVDGFAAAINAAIADLEKLANYAAVEAAIAAIPADRSIYTTESLKVVDDAVDAVVYGLGETQQDTVDGFAAAINAAVKDLDVKAADYAKVEAAKGKIPADLSIYTDKSVAALRNAVAAVVEGLDITKQADVDAMADAITAAIGKLELKPTEGRVMEASYTDTPYAANTFTVKIEGRPVKLRFVDKDNELNTVTLNRTRARELGKIVSYDADNNVVSDLSRNIAYEIWTFDLAINPDVYYLNVKGNEGWEDLSLSYICDYKYSTDDAEVYSMDIADTAKMYTEIPLTVVTGTDVLKVQVVVNGVVLKTFANATIADGKATYDIYAKFYAVGENTVTLNIKTADGWSSVDGFSATVTASK